MGGFEYQPPDSAPSNPYSSGEKDGEPKTADAARLLAPRLGGTNLYLVGLMGSGKTAVGSSLALRLGSYTFLDTDKVITDLTKVPISEYFESEVRLVFLCASLLSCLGTHLRRALSPPPFAPPPPPQGEEAFRELESNVLSEIHGHVRLVVSTGGGIVVKPFNWSKLQTGIVVFLDVDVKVIAERLKGDTTRPLLSDDVEGDLTRIMAER